MLTRSGFKLGLCLTVMTRFVLAQIAPDASTPGPFSTTTFEYRFAATLDPDVSGLPTELWARMWMPAGANNNTAGPLPLLVFLHGNHATCGHGQNPRIDDNTQYTFFGTCPPAAPIVVPNHEGYGYLAERLASWGYVVVSINANRGITAAPGPAEDLGNNLARGRLILKHLQFLSTLNNGGTPNSNLIGNLAGVDLTGRIDFSHVGLFGHSRGGEGVRAAYNLYTFGDPIGVPWQTQIPDAVTFEGLFEVGPVDGQTSLIVDPIGVKWNVLLPMCDGDVSNLQGVRPFDRAMQSGVDDPTQKSTFTVWGANHNFYNTEWQLSDSPGCAGPGNLPLFPPTIGSPSQRQTALASVMAFFRANVGPLANPVFNQNFNPLFGLPPVITSVTRVDRGYTDAPSPSVTVPFEDFRNPTGLSAYGIPNDAMNITIQHVTNGIPNHNSIDPYGRQSGQRSALISWSAAGGFFQTNWTAPGDGNDISNLATLDFRVSRQCSNPPTGTLCAAPSPLNPVNATNFSIRLAMANGSLSNPVQLSRYLDLPGPVGTAQGNPFPPPNLHPILQTARIPLTDFGAADLTAIRGVRLTFDGTPTGAIYLTDIGISSIGSGTPPPPPLVSSSQEPSVPSQQPTVNDVNTIVAVRRVGSSAALRAQPAVEVEVRSSRAFTVHDELFVMRVGNQESKISRYPDSGDTQTLIFTFPASSFSATPGQPVTVQFGSLPSSIDWNFGSLP